MVRPLGGARLKVAMISPYGPAWVGGIARFTMSLSNELRKSGVRVEVFVNQGGSKGLVNGLPGPKLVFVLRVVTQLRRYRPHVLHAHAHWHALLPAVMYKLFHHDVKLVFTVHTPPRQPTRPRSWILKKLMARCDVVTGVSWDIVRWLSQTLPKGSRVERVSPGGTILSGSYHESRHELLLPDSSFVAAFVGPLYWPEKVAGVKLLARSFDHFAKLVPDSKLFIVGGGPHLDEVRKFVANLHAGPQIVLVGEARDPAKYVQACDVYTHVSYMEGLPLSVLDAMFAAKAIIASNVGDIPEIVKSGESGILVANKEREIVAALWSMSSNPAARDRLGKTGRHLILGSYTWEKVARTFLEYYRGTVTP